MSETQPSTTHDAAWLAGIPAQWIAEVNGDGTIRLESASGTLIAAKGAGECLRFTYPPPIGDLDQGDIGAFRSELWHIRVGYVMGSGSNVYCRDLGDGQVMVLLVPGDVTDRAEVLGSIEPVA